MPASRRWNSKKPILLIRSRISITRYSAMILGEVVGNTDDNTRRIPARTAAKPPSRIRFIFTTAVAVNHLPCFEDIVRDIRGVHKTGERKRNDSRSICQQPFAKRLPGDNVEERRIKRQRGQ